MQKSFVAIALAASFAAAAPFRDMTRPVYDKWAKTIGPGLVKQAETEIAARM